MLLGTCAVLVELCERRYPGLIAPARARGLRLGSDQANSTGPGPVWTRSAIAEERMSESSVAEGAWQGEGGERGRVRGGFAVAR